MGFFCDRAVLAVCLRFQAVGLVCFVLERNVVGDDVVIDVFEECFACFWLGIDQERIFIADDSCIRQYAALCGQEECIDAFARLQLLDVVGAERVDQAGSVFTGDAYSAVRGEI